MQRGNPSHPSRNRAPIDPTTSVISAASASQIGELFQYTIGSVSLGRQKSAMIPIVTDDIEAEQLSIYNGAVLYDHPLLGARVKNNTGKYLLQGPITVLDRGAALRRRCPASKIVPPGPSNASSAYGIDQQVLVKQPRRKNKARPSTGKTGQRRPYGSR